MMITTVKNLLNKNSLSLTIDNINLVYFYGNNFKDFKTDETAEWILSRYNTEHSYNKSFGITAKDWKSDLRTFTGERFTSPASLNHIHAQEAGRALNILKRHTSLKMPALQESNKNFIKLFLKDEQCGKHEGTFCCGPCTVSLWRNMSVGGYGSYGKKLNNGFSILKKFRKNDGEWSRFPFYYTLSVLLESAKLPNAIEEIEYAYDKCSKRIKTIRGDDKFADRKRELLNRIINL